MDAPQEPSLFFAGSDGEEDVSMENLESKPSTPPGSRQKPALFLEDSEDEETHASVFVTPAKRGRGVVNNGSDSDGPHPFDMKDFLDPSTTMESEQAADIPENVSIPRASSVSSMSSGPSLNNRMSSPTPSIEIVKPPVKKRRVEPVPITPPNKSSDSIYLGSIIVGNAWSTSRGKGVLYV